MFIFKKTFKFVYIGIIILSLMLTMATTSVAKQPRIANMIVLPDGIELSLLQPVLNIHITISGPGGLYFQKQLDLNDPYIPLYTLGKNLSDGYYKYEITALSSQEAANSRDNYKSQLNNGRDKASLAFQTQKNYANHAKLYQSGGFRILKSEGIEKTEISTQELNKGDDADE